MISRGRSTSDHLHIRTLTVLTLGAVNDESLDEHVPQRLLDRLSLQRLFALARVAGVDADVGNLWISDD